MSKTFKLGFALWIGWALTGASAAMAGYRITYEAVSYSQETETAQVVNRQKNVLLIDKGRFRTVGGDVQGFDLIANIGDSTIYVIDAVQKAYAVIPFPDRADTDGVVDNGTFRIETVETGPTLNGYPTRQYKIYEDGNLIRELYTSERFMLGFDFMFAMEGLERAFQDFAPSEDFGDLRSLFRQVDGVPLKDIQYYPYGRDVLQTLKIERVAFRPEEFFPPAGCAKKTLRELSEGGVDGEDKDTENTPSTSP